MLTEVQYSTLWDTHFKPLCKNPIPPYKEYLDSERMFEDYMDIFRGINTREERADITIPYPHPFFDDNKPKLPIKPYIRYVMIGEARPSSQANFLNSCGGDSANSYFYNINHVKQTPWLSAPFKALYPALTWKSPICPSDKVERLLQLAAAGYVLLDLFPFALSYNTNFRERLNKSSVTNSFWDDSMNAYSIKNRINTALAAYLHNNWDLAFVAPCKISEYIVNPQNGFQPLTIPTIGLHPVQFRSQNQNLTRCNLGAQWRKVAVSSAGSPTQQLIQSAF